MMNTYFTKDDRNFCSQLRGKAKLCINEDVRSLLQTSETEVRFSPWLKSLFFNRCRQIERKQRIQQIVVGKIEQNLKEQLQIEGNRFLKHSKNPRNSGIFGKTWSLGCNYLWNAIDVTCLRASLSRPKNSKSISTSAKIADIAGRYLLSLFHNLKLLWKYNMFLLSWNASSVE